MKKTRPLNGDAHKTAYLETKPLLGKKAEIETYKCLESRIPPQATSKDFQNDGDREKLTRSQKWILWCLCIVGFPAFASMSIIAPFFPYELSLRQQSSYISGLIFSVYAIAVVIASSIFGLLSRYIGPRFMLLAGVTISGTANIIFGLLDYIQDDQIFIFSCFTVRIIEAIGAASFSTANLIYLFEIFPDHVGYAFSMTETSVTLGTTLGPALGGVLYSWAGYGVPFYVLGFFSYLTLPLCLIKIPKISARRRNVTSSASYFQLLKIPRIFIICIAVWVLAQSLSFLDPTLEPFFRSIDLNVSSVSLAFFLLSGTICVLLPFLGKLANSLDNEFLLIFSGLSVNALGLIALGCSDFFNFQPSLYLSLVALVVTSIGFTFAFVPTFESILCIAVENGMEDNLATYGTVSGLWSIMFALGEATGPLLGGALTHSLHFPVAATFMSTFSFVMAIAAGITMIWQLKSS